MKTPEVNGLKLCDGNHPGREARIGEYTKDQCRVCWRALNPERIRNKVLPKRRGVNPRTNAQKLRVSLPLCKHLGEETGETTQCKTCKGTVKLKLFHCDLHSRCVLGKNQIGAHGCEQCPDHAKPDYVPVAGGVRHLLYHVWPVRGNSTWDWHVRQLRERIHLFNGRKILAVVTDQHSETIETVRQQVHGLFHEVLEFPNDPALRETLTFEPLFSRVRSLAKEDCLLWGHAKGVGRNHHPTVRRWAELQYSLYMDNWEIVEQLLRKYPVVGAFKKVGRGWSSNESFSDWHFSGSWFWVRNRDLFGLSDWKRIDKFWSGIEPYPSLHFAPEEAGCIFYEGPVPKLNLYDPRVWSESIEPAYSTWIAQRHREQYPEVGGLKVELGGGTNPLGGEWLNVDVMDHSAVTHKVDFETSGLPFSNDSVGSVYTSHCLEHIGNLQGLLREVVRVCKIGANVEIRVPHWLSPMALCHGHKQVIPPEQIDHWCKSALDYWWKGCSKRFEHIRTEQIPSDNFQDAKVLYPDKPNDLILKFVPGAAHEVRYYLRVVAND